MNEVGGEEGEGIRERISALAGEGALGELAQFLVDNPWTNQALQVAFGARERASQAGIAALRNLNLPTSTDFDRLNRRLLAPAGLPEEVVDIVGEHPPA